jgi:hypothetical protein
MDSATFASLVARVLASSEHGSADGAWEAAAAAVAQTFAQYPDGVTDAILFTKVREAARDATRGCGPLTWRHLAPGEVLEAAIRSISEAFMMELDAGKASPKLLHSADEHFLPVDDAALRTSLLVTGRRLRLTQCSLVETALTGHGPMLLLPTRYVAPVLEPECEADQSILRSSYSQIRSKEIVPSQPLVLRLSRVNEPECHQGRWLRRLLLCQPSEMARAAASVPPQLCEVEAELILWEDDLAFVPLLSQGSLLCALNVQVLTAGSAEPGGAPAQLGVTPSTVLCLVHEKDVAHAAGAVGAPAEDRHAEGGSSRSPTGGYCIGRVMAPTQLVHSHEPAPAETLGPPSAPAATCMMHVRLELHDCNHGRLTLSLAVAPGAEADACHLANSVHPGHHIFVSGVHLGTSTASAVGTLRSAAYSAANTHAHPSSAPRATLSNLSCLTGAMRSTRLLAAASCSQPTVLPTGVAPPGVPSLAEALARGTDAFVCSAALIGWCTTTADGALVSVAAAEADGGRRGSSHRFAVRLDLSDLLDGETISCAVSDAVLETLLDGSAVDLSGMPPEAQRRRLGGAMWKDRMWALTRIPVVLAPDQIEWLINLTCEAAPCE